MGPALEGPMISFEDQVFLQKLLKSKSIDERKLSDVESP
jgi:hypothetical protein